MTKHNVARGYTEFTVVEGRVVWKDYDGNSHSEFHTWIKLANGRICDPTEEQFWNKYPWDETPYSGFRYVWRREHEYSPDEFLREGCDITPEFEAWHYKETLRGEYFRGAMWEYEKEHPDFIPERFRA